MDIASTFKKYFVADVLPSPEQEGRLHVLDGMRGWAALSVVLFHFFYELFGAVHPEFRATYSHFLTNGPFAVVVFFVLSGQALSISYIQRRDKDGLNRMAIKRYPRLAIPVLASCLVIYGLMKFGLVWNVAAADIVGRQDWLGSFLPASPSFWGVLQDGLLNTFLSKSDYNYFLWTMMFEFFGSAFVFLILYLYRFLVSPVLMCLTFGLIFLGLAPFISCFFFGVSFSLLYTNGFFEKLKNSKAWQYISIGLLLLIVALDTLFCPHSKDIDRLHIVLAVFLVFVAQTHTALIKFFSAKISQVLGKLSFPVYLVHLAVLISVTSWMILRLSTAPTMEDALWIGGAGVLISYFGAVLFLPVERMTSKVGNLIADLKTVKRG